MRAGGWAGRLGAVGRTDRAVAVPRDPLGKPGTGWNRRPAGDVRIELGVGVSGIRRMCREPRSQRSPVGVQPGAEGVPLRAQQRSRLSWNSPASSSSPTRRPSRSASARSSSATSATRARPHSANAERNRLRVWRVDPDRLGAAVTTPGYRDICRIHRTVDDHRQMEQSWSQARRVTARGPARASKSPLLDCLACLAMLRSPAHFGEPTGVGFQVRLSAASR